MTITEIDTTEILGDIVRPACIAVVESIDAVAASVEFLETADDSITVSEETTGAVARSQVFTGDNARRLLAELIAADAIELEQGQKLADELGAPDRPSTTHTLPVLVMSYVSTTDAEQVDA